MTRFIELLLERELVDRAMLGRAERVVRSEGRRLDRVLNDLGLLEDDSFADAWACATGWSVAAEADYPSLPILADGLTPAFLRSAEVVPIRVEAGVLDLAVLDPLDPFPAAAIAAKTGLTVRSLIGRPRDVIRALDCVSACNFDPVRRGIGVQF